MTQNDPVFRSPNLTPRQKQVLPILAATHNATEAARLSEVSLSTLNRWLHDDDFREELTRLRDEAAELARCELQGIMLYSIGVLAEAMQDPNPAIRIRAARSALSFSIQLNDMKKLKQDVEALELALPVWAKHYSNL